MGAAARSSLVQKKLKKQSTKFLNIVDESVPPDILSVAINEKSPFDEDNELTEVMFPSSFYKPQSSLIN